MVSEEDPGAEDGRATGRAVGGCPAESCSLPRLSLPGACPGSPSLGSVDVSQFTSAPDHLLQDSSVVVYRAKQAAGHTVLAGTLLLSCDPFSGDVDFLWLKKVSLAEFAGKAMFPCLILFEC